MIVYDVSSRESFDALPKWYSELETYVSSSVVKIVVGNKVDKVYLWFCGGVSVVDHLLLQEFSRQVTPAEGQAFATRMDSLFIEASAKTAVGVKEAFQEVVEKIIDTPELWETTSSGAKTANKSTPNARSGMPGGNVDLSSHESSEGGGCAC